MFKLVNATVQPLTMDLAKEFRDLEPSPTERDLNPARVKHLREKAEAGQLVTFHWSTAKLGDKKLRMNGQHSSNMLADLNGKFPEGLQVHLDEYEVDGPNALAILFRQFDDRKSGRTAGDVAGAYQGLFPDLVGVSKKTAKLGVEGIAWYRREILGTYAGAGDDNYEMFSEARLHPFLVWLGELFDIKTPELKRASIVSAIFGTWETNPTEAKKFWHDVARGGVEYEDTAPATVLDAWLKAAAETQGNDLKPGNYYQACIYAWNAHRDSKTVAGIKHDTKKGMLPISD